MRSVGMIASHVAKWIKWCLDGGPADLCQSVQNAHYRRIFSCFGIYDKGRSSTTVLMFSVRYVVGKKSRLGGELGDWRCTLLKMRGGRGTMGL
jgi:hypothetical protein